MRKGHVVYEVIVVVLVLMAVMIAYMKFSGKPLVQRADQAVAETPAAPTPESGPTPAPIAPSEPQIRAIPDEMPEEHSFLENEAYTLFAYGSYHSMLPAAILPPASPYPQVDPARDSAALRPQGEEEILVHGGIFTGYIPASHLTASADLCAALAEPAMLNVRVCGTEASCLDGAIAEQQNHRGVAFVLFDPEIAANVFYSASSNMVTVKNIDTSKLGENAEYIAYDGLLLVTAEQLASAAACF